MVKSAKNEYNLLATEVLPNICLQENGMLSIPVLPEALQNCGVAASRVEDAESEDVDRTTTEVKIVFNNSPSPDISIFKTVYRCTKLGSFDETGNVRTMVVAAVVLSSTVAVCLSICLLVFLWRRRLMETQGRWRMETEEQDKENHVYGLYYTEDGQKIDQGTSVVVDSNPYYSL